MRLKVSRECDRESLETITNTKLGLQRLCKGNIILPFNRALSRKKGRKQQVHNFRDLRLILSRLYVFPATWSSEAPRRDRVMEQPLLKPCIVSPSSVFRVVIMRRRRRRLATAESTKGLEDTWPLESLAWNKEPSRSEIFIRSANLTYVARFTTGQTILSWEHVLRAKTLELFPRSGFLNSW